MNAPSRLPITSRAEFLGALRSAFGQAADAGAREIWLCDPTFADWPLSESAVIENLTRWVDSQHRMTLLAHSFDEVGRRHARWSQWRRQWSHVVQCRSNSELEEADYPTLCLVPGVVSVYLADPVRHRGIASTEAADGLTCRERIDAVSQRSGETFPVTQLGL
jgi:hypothetical protein